MCLVTLDIPECDTRVLWEIHQPTNGNHLNGNEHVFKCLNCLVLQTSYKWEKKTGTAMPGMVKLTQQWYCVYLGISNHTKNLQ